MDQKTIQLVHGGEYVYLALMKVNGVVFTYEITWNEAGYQVQTILKVENH